MIRRVMPLVAALLLALLPPLALAYGDEGHGEEEKPAGANPRVMNVTVEVGGRAFKLIVTETPPDPRVGEEVQFEVAIVEIIEGGFLGGEIPVENTRLVTAEILSTDGKAVADPIETHTENDPGTYGIHTTFDEAGEYRLALAVVTEDGVELRAEFPIPVSVAPINYVLFVWDGLFLLIGLGVFGVTYAAAQKQLRSPRQALERLAPGTSVGAMLLAASILTVHFFIPTTQARAEAESSGLTVAGDVNEIVIPKESQILFGIRTEEIQSAKIISGVTANGIVHVRPQFKAEVVPPVSGRTRFGSRMVTVGDVVGAGEIIAVVEQVLSAPEVAALEATRTDLETKAIQLQSDASQAKQQLDLAKIEMERSERLYEAGAAALRRLQNAELAVTLAEERYAAALEQAEATEVGQQRVDAVRAFPLRAPISGLITQVNFTPGQQVEAGESLFMIMDLGRVWVEAQVYEKDLHAVTDAARATFKVSAFPDQVFAIDDDEQGKLLTISPVVDPETRTVSVIYEVINLDGMLRDGMFAQVTIDTSGDREVLAVPKESVIDQRGKKIVYVFAGGEHFERRTVTLGARGQAMVEITSGLASGDRVVTEGIYQLRSLASALG